MSLVWTPVKTRLGEFTVVAHNGHIVKIQLPGSHDDWRPQVSRWFPDEEPLAIDDPVLDAARRQIEEYADGRRRSFDLPMKPMGTDFQQDVWAALGTIPYGETRSYADLAAMVGKPGAARAVGQANARNPIPIVQPCHRVLQADGSLGGWMGASADDSSLKRVLLDLENGPVDGLRPLGPSLTAGLGRRPGAF